MSSSQTAPAHTAGPWEVHNDARFENPFRIVSANGELIANLNVKGYALDKGQANGTLIAAAPDLLEACKKLVAAMNQLDKGHHAEVAFAESAIAKSESL
jgi:hypothetical protein